MNVLVIVVILVSLVLLFYRTAIFEFTEEKSLKKSTIKFEKDDGTTLTYVSAIAIIMVYSKYYGAYIVI